jgi:hypothetical protein
MNDIGEARMLESVRVAYVDGATLRDPAAAASTTTTATTSADPSADPSLKMLFFVAGQCAELSGAAAVTVGRTLANRRKIQVRAHLLSLSV